MQNVKLEKQISTTWSANLAYSVGLIATDGSLSKDGRHIDLTSKDLDQLTIFRKCLDINAKVGSKADKAGGEKIYHRVQVSSVSFYNWLLKIGLTPNKSKSLHRLTIPTEYFFDFLRGCFDGDGSVYSYMDARYKNSFMFYVQFTSASKPFLLWLQEIILELTGVEGKINASTRSFQLRFAKNGSQVIFNRMYQRIYQEKSHCFLKRKFVKVQKILIMNEKVKNAQVAKLVDAYA